MTMPERAALPCEDSAVYVATSEPHYGPTPDAPAPHVDFAIGRLLDAVASCGHSSPFAHLRPGDVVVLKPNWVSHENPLGYGIESLVTHSSVIESVARRAAEALSGAGTVVIGDAPIQSCDFERLLECSGMVSSLERLKNAFPGVRFVIEDWRLTLTDPNGAFLRTAVRTRSPGPDHCLVDLGTRSFLEDLVDRARDFRVTCYPPSMMRRRHGPGKHEYLVARRALEADLVINLAKLKTHAKGGLTACLKNLIGINAHKEFLPHHTQGGPAERGDSYSASSRLRRSFDRYYDFHFEHLASFRRPAVTLASRLLAGLQELTERLTDGVDFGSWPGNDTIWRTALDINHLLYFYAERRPKRIFNLVDAVVVGAGDGPLAPRPAPGGMLLAGNNPAYIDAAGARILGYSLDTIPMVWAALHDERSRFKQAPLEASSVIFARDSAAPTFGGHADLPVLDVLKPKHWQARLPPHRRTYESRARARSEA